MTDSVDGGLLALLGTAVSATVFTAGFASVRHHAAVQEARRRTEEPGRPALGPPADRAALADEIMDDAGSRRVLVGNVVLSLVVAGAIILALIDGGLGRAGVGTLVGFAIVQAVILAIGYRDRTSTRGRISAALGVTQPAVAGAARPDTSSPQPVSDDPPAGGA